MWDSKGSQRVLKVPNGVPRRGLELMVSALGSMFGKEEVGVRFLLFGIISSISHFNEGLSARIFMLDS
jgi:hypothetical protein